MQSEPVGLVLAMQSTQEGQQVALNKEVTLPAFAKHYGYQRGARSVDVDVRDALFQQGILTHPGSPEVMAKLLKDDLDRCRKLITEARIALA